VFLDPAGAREITIAGADLAAAISRVRDLVDEERRAPSPLAPAVFAEP
jgi:hypothetical protein